MKVVSHITTKAASSLTLREVLRKRAATEVVEAKKYYNQWSRQ